jgi:hypothetical protein
MGIGTSRCSPACLALVYYVVVLQIVVYQLPAIALAFRAALRGACKVIVDMHCIDIRMFRMHRCGCESGHSFGLDVEVGPASCHGIPNSYTHFRIVDEAALRYRQRPHFPPYVLLM